MDAPPEPKIGRKTQIPNATGLMYKGLRQTPHGQGRPEKRGARITFMKKL
jgi:hypothetical protein